MTAFPDTQREELAAQLERVAVEAKRIHDDYVDKYCTRRIDHREGDFTEAQLAEWQQQADSLWRERYPAPVALLEDPNHD